MQRYFKIGELAKLYGISVDSIRYYEKIGLIHPQRLESGYRIYGIHDIWRLNVIRELRGLGFDMEQIHGYLATHTVNTTLQFLAEEERFISSRLAELETLRQNVRERLTNIQAAQALPLNQIQLQHYPQRHCFATQEGYTDEYEMDVLMKNLLNLNKKHFYIIGNNQLGTRVAYGQKQPDKIQYKAAFILDTKGTEALPEGDYLSVSYSGQYSKTKYWIQQLLDYAHKHNLEPQGDFLELLWIEIHTTANLDERVTELQILVKNR